MSHKQSTETGRRKIRPTILALGTSFLAPRHPAAPCADRPVLRRLMLPLAGALLLLVAGFSAAMLWHQKRHLDEMIASSIAAIPEDFHQVLKLQTDTLCVALRFIVDNPEMRAALKAGDREGLLLGHRALFNELHREQGISHLYFHGPDRVNLLRVHSPEKWGDVINRFTAREAQRTGKTVAGIELGPLGTFSLRAVEPVFDDDGLLGFVELGEEVAGILEWLRGRPQIDIAVVVHKALLNRPEWQATMAALGREADWDRFPDGVLIYNSLTQFPTVLDPYVNEDDLTGADAKLELTVAGTSRRVAFLPLMDASGREVGHFIVLCDISSQRETFARLLCITGAGCLLLLTLLLAFFYVALRNTDRGIEARALALQEESLFRKAVIANAGEGLCVGHETGDARLLTFTVWNDRMTEITGYTMDEINHLGWHQLMPRDTEGLARVVAQIERMELGEEVQDEEWTVIRRDGQERTLLVSTSFLVSNGPQTHILALVQDITERKQLEGCVQNQLQLLRTLMDAIPYPVYYKDTELRYLGCNRAFEDLFGASEGQLIGKTIYDIASKDLADRYHAADQELLARPGSQIYEGFLESVDGVRHRMLFRKATFQNSEGGVGGIVGVAVDAAELAPAEEALLARDSGLNSATDGIVVTDLAGRLTYANPSCLRMWGFDHEYEILDKSFTALVCSEPEGSAVCRATLETGLWRGELAARRKDGSEFIVQVSASIVRDKQGEPLCLMASLVDVTEDRRIHDILDRKQKNLEAIFDAAPLGMLLVNEQRRVVRANDAIRQLSGKDYPQILNQHPCQVLDCAYGSSELPSPGGHPPCETCSLQKLMDAALESGSPVHGVETQPVLRRNGEQVRPWFSISVEPVSIDGDKHILITLNDVTDRKEAQEQVREMMEMTSQFISAVSHELRTPLTAMKKAVITVADGIAGKLKRDQTHFLDIARRNVDRLARLIDNVLDFQKLSAGKVKFHMRSNDIRKTIDDAYNTMRPQARRKRLTLSLDLEPDLPSFVYDHDRMIQVLTNLLSNAIKFTPEGGRIVLGARHQGESLALSVSDTGLGIPKEALPRIFTQFYRVQRPGKEIKGTGLGLANVNRIVAAHGGRIDVESEVDKGTTFTVVLPLAPPTARGRHVPQGDARLENAVTKHAQA